METQPLSDFSSATGRSQKILLFWFLCSSSLNSPPPPPPPPADRGGCNQLRPADSAASHLRTNIYLSLKTHTSIILHLRLVKHTHTHSLFSVLLLCSFASRSSSLALFVVLYSLGLSDSLLTSPPSPARSVSGRLLVEERRRNNGGTMEERWRDEFRLENPSEET